MQIAICDDDQDELGCISSILDTYREERKASIAYHVFYSATELLTTAKSGDYDLYILDVMMPAINGMEAAVEIRSFDQEAEIVFLTSSPEFAVESYKYKAQNYLLKPARREQIFSLMDMLLDVETYAKFYILIAQLPALLLYYAVARRSFVKTPFVMLTTIFLCSPHAGEQGFQRNTAHTANFYADNRYCGGRSHAFSGLAVH